MHMREVPNIFMSRLNYIVSLGRHIQRGSRRSPDTPEKSQVGIGFLQNTGTDPLEKQLDHFGPVASRGGFVRPSVKYVDDYKKNIKKSC